MLVKLAVNLGHVDARRYGASRRLADDEIDVADSQAAELIARGLAVKVGPGVAVPAGDMAPAMLAAVPPPLARAVPSRPSVNRAKLYENPR